MLLEGSLPSQITNKYLGCGCKTWWLSVAKRRLHKAQAVESFSSTTGNSKVTIIMCLWSFTLTHRTMSWSCCHLYLFSFHPDSVRVFGLCLDVATDYNSEISPISRQYNNGTGPNPPHRSNKSDLDMCRFECCKTSQVVPTCWDSLLNANGWRFSVHARQCLLVHFGLVIHKFVLQKWCLTVYSWSSN